MSCFLLFVSLTGAPFVLNTDQVVAIDKNNDNSSVIISVGNVQHSTRLKVEEVQKRVSECTK